MKKLIAILAPFAMFATGCVDQEPEISSDVDESRRNQSVQMFDFNNVAVPGSKADWRRDVVSTFKVVSSATPGDVMTIWICGWNDPSECQNGGNAAEGNNLCNEPDITPESSFFCQHGGGGIVGPNGQVMVLGLDYQGAEVIMGAGLTNPAGAELHLFLRTHGPAIPGQLLEQLTTFAGGCEINDCADIQFAVIPPLDDDDDSDSDSDSDSD